MTRRTLIYSGTCCVLIESKVQWMVTDLMQGLSKASSEMAAQSSSMLPKKRPKFSTESSDTEYTSSESEEAVAEQNDHCVESQQTYKFCPEIRPEELPIEDLAPSTTCQKVILEKVVTDHGDSDEEMDASLQDVGALEGPTPNATEESVMEFQIPCPCSELSPEVRRVSLGQSEDRILPAAKDSEDVARVSTALLEEGVVRTASEKSEAEARVLMAEQDADLDVPKAAEESEDEASTVSGNYKIPGRAEVFPPDWSCDVFCDMCKGGPSLSSGAWYSWCCGKPSQGCNCTYEDQQQKRKELTNKIARRRNAKDALHFCSGKVHRLCAIWSTEVYQNVEEPWNMMNLETELLRSRKTVSGVLHEKNCAKHLDVKQNCSCCHRSGATLGCEVLTCKRRYHYGCADNMSAILRVRMWGGYEEPIACKDHRHGEFRPQETRKRPGKPAQVGDSSRRGLKAPGDAIDDEIECTDKEWSIHGLVQGAAGSSKCRAYLPSPMGKNLLTLDFSRNNEFIPVPCTNDVDDDAPPYIEYLTKNRFGEDFFGSKECPLPPLEVLAKACKGCTQHELDDPSAPLSVHVPFARREDDYREDWIGERMYGRLPYDKHGRLLIGANNNELVECNEQCECGEFCINRELQKGLTTPIELYKTENKGWAVRTLVAIARGKFVIEYVGELLDQVDAKELGQDSRYVETKQSYMQELDHPASKSTPEYLIDALHASNAARFINHSCDPNLQMYRVYVETTYKWLPHIGFYAMRDIEAGEELAHDYHYGKYNEAIEQENPEEKALTHVRCHCGAKNCNDWLRVASHTVD